MISAKGKSQEQLTAEVRQAIRDYLAARSDGATSPEWASPESD